MHENRLFAEMWHECVNGPKMCELHAGVVNGKSETRRDAKTGILKSETEMEKFSDLIEKHICGQQTQNPRLQDPLVGCVRFQHLGRICSFFRGPFTTPSCQMRDTWQVC